MSKADGGLEEPSPGVVPRSNGQNGRAEASGWNLLYSSKALRAVQLRLVACRSAGLSSCICLSAHVQHMLAPVGPLLRSPLEQIQTWPMVQLGLSTNWSPGIAWNICWYNQHCNSLLNPHLLSTSRLNYEMWRIPSHTSHISCWQWCRGSRLVSIPNGNIRVKVSFQKNHLGCSVNFTELICNLLSSCARDM